MALKATIFKATMNIADVDRDYYRSHALTVARHPSETDERMMLRLLAFALHADEALLFSRGLSAEDEPDLWQKNLIGDIDIWIDVGQPDEKRIRKACARATRVFVYTYGGHGAEIWWDQMHRKLQRFKNLSVINIPADTLRVLAELAQRTMQLQCTIEDGQLWISDNVVSVLVEPKPWTPV
jgi:uncharacterized protein YaeQ